MIKSELCSSYVHLQSSRRHTGRSPFEQIVISIPYATLRTMAYMPLRRVGSFSIGFEAHTITPDTIQPTAAKVIAQSQSN